LDLHETEDTGNTISNRDDSTEFLEVSDLVDGRHLGLEDGNGISDGWLLVGNSRGSESSHAHVDEVLLSHDVPSESRQHV